MLSPALASRAAFSLGHILWWPGIQWKTFGPNQICSNRGPDSQHCIRGKEVRGRVQEEEGGLGVCKDRKGDEWASEVTLEAPSKGVTEGCDLYGEAG